jgi:hypothetical protein
LLSKWAMKILLLFPDNEPISAAICRASEMWWMLNSKVSDLEESDSCKQRCPRQGSSATLTLWGFSSYSRTQLTLCSQGSGRYICTNNSMWDVQWNSSMLATLYFYSNAV